MPHHEGEVALVADAALPVAAVSGQALIEEVAVGLADYLEPHGVVVEPLHAGYLHEADTVLVVHHGEAAHPVVFEHAPVGDMPGSGHHDTGGARLDVYLLVAGVSEGVAMLLHKADLPFEFLGLPQVVAVEEGYPAAFGDSQGSVSGERGAFVALVVIEGDSVVGGFECGDSCYGVVGGAVVDDDEFPVGVGLCEHAPNALFDVFGAVVGRHDDGYEVVHMGMVPFF